MPPLHYLLMNLSLAAGVMRKSHYASKDTAHRLLYISIFFLSSSKSMQNRRCKKSVLVKVNAKQALQKICPRQSQCKTDVAKKSVLVKVNAKQVLQKICPRQSQCKTSVTKNLSSSKSMQNRRCKKSVLVKVNAKQALRLQNYKKNSKY